VVHEPDNALIGDEEGGMHDKYLHDMHELDRLEHKKIVDAIIFGNNNKKRKRNEVEGLDMEDNPIVKKKRLNERE
jgi:hypothetical protein